MGERELATAILRQAWRDLHAADPAIQHDALRFWGTPEAVEYWEDLLHLDGALQRHVVRALETPERLDTCPRQLSLFARGM